MSMTQMWVFLDQVNGPVYPVHQLGNVAFRAWQACCTTTVVAFSLLLSSVCGKTN
jgi:hypothetical protein